jgi:predicted nucleotidyltransferase
MDVWKSVPKDIRAACPNLSSSRTFTIQKIREIRKEIAPSLRASVDPFDLIIAGSMGRQEAHSTSDVDAFVLLREGKSLKHHKNFAQLLLKQLSSTVKGKTINLRMAKRGTFSAFCSLEQIVSNIGGKRETNNILTRRMVLLAEAKGLGQSHDLSSIKREIVKKYLQDLQPPSDRRPIFLMNDLVRYYRTMCVDYEYKKNESGKPWAERLMKLRHSRKLFYCSSLMPLLQSVHEKPETRVKWIQDQFVNFTPLERVIWAITNFGQARHWDILIHYDRFIELMASPERRERLKQISFERRDKDADYLLLRNNSREFRSALLDLMFHVKAWRETISNYIVL